MQVSVTMITKNEADSIRASLESIRWASEIIVVDSGSTDQTVQIAQEFGARVFHHHFVDFADQKNYAGSQVSSDWILNLDADEVCTRDLAVEISELPESGPDGYWISRKNFFQGRWIRHGGWFPDYKLRLYRRNSGSWLGIVHETVQMRDAAPEARLKGLIEHYTYKNWDRYLQSIRQFARLAAQQMQNRGRSSGILDLIVRPPAAFLKKYLLQLGFLDGWPGLVISVMTAYGIFLRFACLRDLNRNAKAYAKLSGKIDESRPR